MTTTQDVTADLERIGQAHLLRFQDELSDAQKQALHEQIASLDLDAIPDLVEWYVKNKPSLSIDEDDLQPADFYPLDAMGGRRQWDRDHYRDLGIDLISRSKVGVFTVAGGQGSRLGYDGPKGCYPANPVDKKPLFQVFAEGIRAAENKWGAGAMIGGVPWYIMTSPLNHDATLAFFEKHNYFGLEKEQVMFFQQGTLPSFDMESGKILLAEKGVVATNPDGHGGSLKALHKSGALDHMQDKGIEHISYIQVDNPLARVLDPVFIGLHAHAPDSSGEMSSKMVAKTDPAEKVGVFAKVGGKTQVIEYSDLPDNLANQHGTDGMLAYCAGSIAIHIISAEFVRKVASDPAFALPLHRAEKKVPHVDDKGKKVEPDAPNAVKLEAFVFDALAMCQQSVVLETDRMEEFAPIKNAEGSDSPETSARIQTIRAAHWLDRAGVHIPKDNHGGPDCTIALSPLTAIDPQDLRGEDVDLPKQIEAGASVSI